MSLDPCIPPAAPSAPSAAHRPLHRLPHHVGSRHFHRLHHTHAAGPTAPTPSYSCGKHFAEDQSQPGGLAARPTDGGQTLVAAKGKAITAKLAATGAASLLGAAALAGALALPAGFGTVPAGDSVRHGPQFGAASVASGPVAPGLDAQQGQAVTFPVASSGAGQAPTPVPEPSSLALLGGFATLVLAASVLRDAVWKDVSSTCVESEIDS